jgi:hypothetical protein
MVSSADSARRDSANFFPLLFFHLHNVLFLLMPSPATIFPITIPTGIDASRVNNVFMGAVPSKVVTGLCKASKAFR